MFSRAGRGFERRTRRRDAALRLLKRSDGYAPEASGTSGFFTHRAMTLGAAPRGSPTPIEITRLKSLEEI